MMGRPLTRRTIVPAVAWLLTSCASPNPALYTLEVPPGPVRRGGPRTIELRTVGIARYLERSQIVRSSEKFQARRAAQRLVGGTVGRHAWPRPGRCASATFARKYGVSGERRDLGRA